MGDAGVLVQGIGRAVVGGAHGIAPVASIASLLLGKSVASHIVGVIRFQSTHIFAGIQEFLIGAGDLSPLIITIKPLGLLVVAGDETDPVNGIAVTE